MNPPLPGTMRLHRLEHDFPQTDAFPALPGEHVMRICESLEPRDEHPALIFGGRAEGLPADRSHQSERVLQTVPHLVQQDVLVLLRRFPIADVAGDLRGADNPAVPTDYRRDAQRDVEL